jgi:hypothetical protein
MIMAFLKIVFVNLISNLVYLTDCGDCASRLLRKRGQNS